MIEIWPLWWVDRALTAFSAIMDFESTIFRSIFIRKMIRHSFNYLLMLYVSYNLHESKEVLFYFSSSSQFIPSGGFLRNTCQPSTSHVPMQSCRSLSPSVVPLKICSKETKWIGLFLQKARIDTNGFSTTHRSLEMTMQVLHDAKKLLWHKVQDWVVWVDLMPRCENIAIARGRVQLVQMNSLTWRI